MRIKTRQQVFDRVARHLLRQNQQAMNEDGGCFYRMKSADGKVLRCAVGCLIPRRLYRPEFEDASIFGILPIRPSIDQDGFNAALVAVGLTVECHADLLGALQSAHDSDEPTAWRRRLWVIAAEFSLNTEVLDKC